MSMSMHTKVFVDCIVVIMIFFFAWIVDAWHLINALRETKKKKHFFSEIIFIFGRRRGKMKTILINYYCILCFFVIFSVSHFGCIYYNGIDLTIFVMILKIDSTLIYIKFEWNEWAVRALYSHDFFLIWSRNKTLF